MFHKRDVKNSEWGIGIKPYTQKIGEDMRIMECLCDGENTGQVQPLSHQEEGTILWHIHAL